MQDPIYTNNIRLFLSGFDEPSESEEEDSSDDEGYPGGLPNYF